MYIYYLGTYFLKLKTQNSRKLSVSLIKRFFPSLHIYQAAAPPQTLSTLLQSHTHTHTHMHTHFSFYLPQFSNFIFLISLSLFEAP